MSAAPHLAPEPSGAPMTVIFDQTSNFAAPPNLLGLHPGRYALHGWLTMKLAPIAHKKRLKPGWHVIVSNEECAGALLDRNRKVLLTFEIVKGHKL